MPRPSSVWSRKGRDGWWTTINGKQICLGSDYAEAQKEFHRLKGGQKPLPPTKATVGQLVNEYLDWVRGRVKPKTAANYRGYLRSWEASAGKVAVAGLTVDHMDDWLRSQAWNDSSRHLAVSILRIWAAWCEDRGYLIAALARKVKKPPMGRRQAPVPGALEATLEAVVTPAFRDFAEVLLELGCRPGELRTLEASGVDWETSTAWVEGKTGRRLIGLTTRAVAILRGWAAKYPDGPVLRNSRGLPWTEGAVHTQFRRRSRAAGKGAVLAYHCRHAFWGRAHEAGASDIIVAKQLGHANLNMLAKHYAKVEPDHLRDVAQKASRGSRESPT